MNSNRTRFAGLRFEKAALRSPFRAQGVPFGGPRARNVPAKNDPDHIRACGRELCEASSVVRGADPVMLNFPIRRQKHGNLA